jgi:hypothetical protein
MSTPLPEGPTFNSDCEPAVAPPCAAMTEAGADKAPASPFIPPADPGSVALIPYDYVLIERGLLNSIQDKITELQEWQADYERLKQIEREQTFEPPAFLRRKA